MANARRPGVRTLFAEFARPDQSFASFQEEYDQLPERDRQSLMDDLKYV